MIASRAPAPIIEPSETPAPTAAPPEPTPHPAETKPTPIEIPEQKKSAGPAKPRIRPTPTVATGTNTNNQLLPTPANQAKGDWERYVISKPNVVYPRKFVRTGMQGNGLFQLGIDPKNGTVTEVKVLKHTGYRELDATYVINFFQWKFQPGTITSATIPARLHITGHAHIYH